MQVQEPKAHGSVLLKFHTTTQAQPWRNSIRKQRGNLNTTAATAFTDAARAQVLGVKIRSVLHFFKKIFYNQIRAHSTHIKIDIQNWEQLMVNVTAAQFPCRLL